MSEDALKKPTSRWHVHRWVYYWTLHWAYTPYGIPALICISFAESSFFPLPPDILLIPLVIAAPTKWWRIALYCTLASVFGGLAGYGIGVFAWETVGRWIVENVAHVQLVLVEGRNDIALPSYIRETLGAGLGGEHLFQVYDKWNAWVVYIFGLTPLPYKLITITAGVAKVNLFVFTLTSIAARATRFFIVAWMLKKWGRQATHFINRYFNILCIAFVILLIGGFAIINLVM
ncbi:MAG: DedA family protein [Desulfobulbaceae bacterium]|uniref:DedA family protein n=1 Tax=Candidatus Desulfobia pelagia TaxID=2841692 RepID=A0A8J6NGY0_9BACT|nr:DedA family protein [Candidatus Desulfobia pelagia]